MFDPLRLANLSLKPRKCAFAKSEVTYLGRIISKEGIKVDPAKIEAVKSFPLHHNQHDVRSFFGIGKLLSKICKRLLVSKLMRVLLKEDKVISSILTYHR